MKYLYVVIISLLGLIPLSVSATHIVGGEIQMEPVSNQAPFTHLLTLNLYFDDINGNVQAMDQMIRLAVYRKKDNYFMGFAELPIVSNAIIGYTNPSCEPNNSIRTRLIKYSRLTSFQEDQFDDPGGYYIVWERCCRNAIITNIVSPNSSGSVFYLAFPALRQNGTTFKNASPKFVNLTGDYICRGTPFTFEFGATDPDGDSLTYKLVTPYNGFTSPQLPNPDIPTGSSSYPEVRWGAGYSLQNIIPGPKPLSVNPRTGRLSVTASELGLYVFCVLTEEFRNGKKIGEVRRDFQLKVIDCIANAKPMIGLKEQGKNNFYRSTDVITIKKADKKCLNILATDINLGQSVNVVLQPVNFSGNNYTITPGETRINSRGDSLRAQLCLGECLESFDGKPLIFDLIASDNGCPQPQYDTLRVQVYVEPLSNNKPSILTDLLKNFAEVQAGKQIRFNVLGKDLDNDEITVEARGRGFSLAAYGMNFSGGTATGLFNSPFTWTPDCNQIRKDDYIVDFFITDKRCGRIQKDSVTVTLKALPRTSTPPTVVTTLLNSTIEIVLNGTEEQQLNFDVIANDSDNDPIKLYAQTVGPDFKSLGITWSAKDGVGRINSPFAWKIDCKALLNKEIQTLKINFITEDNSCQPNRFDTVAVNITLKNKLSNFDFKPANIITPNGDGKNDNFTIAEIPEDNCFEKFESIVFFNRWGQEVYRSIDRNFKWEAEGLAVGTYYYALKFTKREFKGWVELLR
ncbi:gliding motility-associated C-terminal domain-containing protein [Pseudarcicella hirudinis]|uniref:Gliding motility-associated C-terminal domain-containing protein n=1 Tax=Pseudarcicella hirudinis TaxID=1079859 RepID=A0A1I5Y8C6_9BACT|nr:gliding motility-associated C-terminal domain-containing protein [Pseudarcicella hirudinis]SFQ40456.1 gliding motility-associated C-terminal domain-containing protein [Pseudarcicella hirudinis]